jgi:hypothetical protein
MTPCATPLVLGPVAPDVAARAVMQPGAPLVVVVVVVGVALPAVAVLEVHGPGALVRVAGGAGPPV